MQIGRNHLSQTFGERSVSIQAGDEVFNVGEKNAKGLTHGIGIRFCPNGIFQIGFWRESGPAPGDYLTVNQGKNWFLVGVRFEEANSDFRHIGTNYNKNGTSEAVNF